MRAAAALAFAVALRMRAAGRGGSEDEVEEVDEAEDEEEVVDAGCTFDFTGHKMAKTRILSKWLTKLTHLCCVLSLF